MANVNELPAEEDRPNKAGEIGTMSQLLRSTCVGFGIVLSLTVQAQAMLIDSFSDGSTSILILGGVLVAGPNPDTDTGLSGVIGGSRKSSLTQTSGGLSSFVVNVSPLGQADFGQNTSQGF